MTKGPTARRIGTYDSCPVTVELLASVAVKPQNQTTDGETTMSNRAAHQGILVGVDGSPSSKAAVRWVSVSVIVARQR